MESENKKTVTGIATDGFIPLTLDVDDDGEPIGAVGVDESHLNRWKSFAHTRWGKVDISLARFPGCKCFAYIVPHTMPAWAYVMGWLAGVATTHRDYAERARNRADDPFLGEAGRMPIDVETYMQQDWPTN